MEMSNKNFKHMDIGFILAHGKEISSQEALRDTCPIEWNEDVLNGKYKEKVIIRSKDKEDK